MTSVVPADVPVTTPVAEIKAIPGGAMLHVPEGAASLNPVVNPWHTERSPKIAGGNGLTVTIVVLKQPEGKV